MAGLDFSKMLGGVTGAINTQITPLGVPVTGGGLANVLGGVGSFASLIPVFGSSINAGLSIVTSLLGGGTKRNSRLVNETLDWAKSESNLASGTLASINLYLKLLSRGYEYQFNVKKRPEASDILNVFNECLTQLDSNGFEVSESLTSQHTSKGGTVFSFTYPVYKQSAVSAVTQETVTEKTVVTDSNGNVIQPKSDLLKYALIGLGALLIISKKTRRKLKL